MVKVNQKKCIGCGGCVAMYPEIFELQEGKASVKKDTKATDEIRSVCPVGAIED